MEVLPPDDWEWVSEWKIDGSGGRDTGGWEYTKEIGKFDASRGEYSDRSSGSDRCLDPFWGLLLLYALPRRLTRSQVSFLWTLYMGPNKVKACSFDEHKTMFTPVELRIATVLCRTSMYRLYAARMVAFNGAMFLCFLFPPCPRQCPGGRSDQTDSAVGGGFGRCGPSWKSNGR